MTPRPSKLAPRASKWAPSASKLAPSASKLAASWPQERPSWPQVGHQSRQVDPKCVQVGAQEASKRRPGALGVQNSPNLGFVLQGSMFFKCFSTMLEACAQTWKYEKRVKTYVFPMFFVGRAFFEKGSAVEGKSTTK